MTGVERLRPLTHFTNRATSSEKKCKSGIRATALCPGEFAMSILDKRPVPATLQERARMVQSDDVVDPIRYIASAAAHVCITKS